MVIDIDNETVVDPLDLGQTIFTQINSFQARRPKDVRYLGCLSIKSSVVGRYSNGCDAVKLSYDITLFDLVTSTKEAEFFVGEEPPYSISGRSCENGIGYPDKKLIRQWLNEHSK